jgi:diaminopimelate epimerase
MQTMPKKMTQNADLVFHKMHGAGNDFVLLDWRTRATPFTARQAGAISDRRTGVGCDQILILHPPGSAGSTARYEVLNADGSSAGQCGNGARCIALFLVMNGEAGSGSLLLESPSGLVRIELCEDGEFEVDMGEPDSELFR